MLKKSVQKYKKNVRRKKKDAKKITLSLSGHSSGALFNM